MKRLVFYVVCVTLLAASLGAENVNVVTPKAGLSINERAGTFSVYLISAKGQRVPIFDEGSGITGFYLNDNNTTYPLLGGAGVTTKANNIHDGGLITYTIAKLADVTVGFTFASTLAGRPANVLRVDVTVLNKSGRPKTFEIKGLFDTILGESDSSFFSTASQNAISAEYLITDIASQRWVKGADNGNSMRFLLYGEGITSPKSVTLANVDRISALNWNAEYSPERRFSPNNVAVDIKWDPMQLQKDQAGGITFYLFLGNGEAPPSATLAALNNARPASQIALVALGPAPTGSARGGGGQSALAGGYEQSGTVAYVPPPTPTHEYPRAGQPPDTAPPHEYPRAEYPQAPAPQLPAPRLPAPRASSPPVVVYITPPARPVKPAVTTGNPADLAYAMDLFDRIQRLGSGPGGVNGINRDEIIRLNDELDRFLARIGQKG